MSGTMSRHEYLTWVNDKTSMNVNKIEDLCSGEDVEYMCWLCMCVAFMEYIFIMNCAFLYWASIILHRPFQMQAWRCITSYPLRGLPYLAYDNVNPAVVNSMMLHSSMDDLKRSIEVLQSRYSPKVWCFSTNFCYFQHSLYDFKLTMTLTLNCIRYPALPLVHNRDYLGAQHMLIFGTRCSTPLTLNCSMGTPPPEKTTFPPEFINYLYTGCIYTNHNHISGKKYKIFVPFQNGGQITDFHFASFRFQPKFEKPLSKRNFSMKFGSN